jgi:type II secretory pathway component PulM
VNNDADDEARLVDELRALTERVDPVPREVTEFAKAALGWRRLDAELAELLSDSALESELATTRSEDPGRWVRFRASDLSIELEVQASGEGHTLLGQLEPAPVSATVEAQDAEGATAGSAEADELGRFRLALPSGGRVRLRVLRRDPSGPEVETSWFSL